MQLLPEYFLKSCLGLLRKSIARGLGERSTDCENPFRTGAARCLVVSEFDTHELHSVLGFSGVKSMYHKKSGIEYEAEIYWTTSRYIADAKRLAVYLTKDDIAQIRANTEFLVCSRHASVRRCRHSLPASEADLLATSVHVSVPVCERTAKVKPQRPKNARKKNPTVVKLPDGVIRFKPHKKAANDRGGGGAA